MLSVGEKAYCAALLALKNKEYTSALSFFEKAAPFFNNDKEFTLYFETTRLLVEVKSKLGTLVVDDKLEIEEIFTHG